MNSASDDRVKNNVMRHEYRTLTENEKADMQAIKDIGLEFIKRLDSLASCLESGGTRQLAISRTKMEEAVMWAVKHITG